MAQYDMIMPKMGESVAEATITKWLKNEGDTVAPDESVLEIATDKVDSEVPAQKGGILVKRLFNEGDVVQVGTVIAIIGDSASSNASVPPVTNMPKVLNGLGIAIISTSKGVMTDKEAKTQNVGGEVLCYIS